MTINGPTTQAGTLTLCVVVPCYNEAEVIESFYTELKPVLEGLAGLQHTILFVDDGSTDQTLNILNHLRSRDSRVEVVSLSRNFGHQVALSAGLDFASGEAVVMMDSDLQHPPGLIPEMVALWRQGFDVVSTIRTATGDASICKRWSSKLFYWVFNALSDVQIPVGAADFCLLSRRAFVALRRMPERHRLLRAMIAWIGFPGAQIRYEAPPRAAGHSKYALSRMLGLALDGVVSFTGAPLRFATRLGGIILGATFLYFCYALYAVLFWQSTIRGWASIVVLIIGLGGVQLFFIGLIGEYLYRLYMEGKGRPLYVVKQEFGLPSSNAQPVVRSNPAFLDVQGGP